MSENGSNPEIYLHPIDERGDFPRRTFSLDGKLGRMMIELDEDLQPHTVIEVLSSDGDEVASRLPVKKTFNGSEGMAIACIKDALGITSGKK